MISASSFTTVYALNINLNLGTTYTTINENNIENNNTTLTLAFYGNTTRINVAYNALKDNPNYTLITINNLENTTLQTIDILFIDIQTIQQEQINFTKTALTLWQMGKGFYVLGYHPQNTTEKYWSFSAAGILHNKTYFEYTINFGGQNENDPQRKSKFETVLIKSVENITRAILDPDLQACMFRGTSGDIYEEYDKYGTKIGYEAIVAVNYWYFRVSGYTLFAEYHFGYCTHLIRQGPHYDANKCGVNYVRARAWCENESVPSTGNVRYWKYFYNVPRHGCWESCMVIKVYLLQSVVPNGSSIFFYGESEVYFDHLIVFNGREKISREHIYLCETDFCVIIYRESGPGTSKPPLIKGIRVGPPHWIHDIHNVPP